MRAVHPSEILREEYLKPLSMSVQDLAIAIHVSPMRMANLMAGGGLTAEVAIRLSRFFGTTAEFWMNIQQAYDIETALYGNENELDKIVHYMVGR